MRLADISPLISAAAFMLSATLVVIKFRQLQRDRFITVTNGLFQIWQSEDFMKAQMWIIHSMPESSWSEFQERHRGQYGEAALLRVTGFYNRVGTLVNLRLVDECAILRTIGGTADAVWKKIEPFVVHARHENPGFLLDFEQLVPHRQGCFPDESR